MTAKHFNQLAEALKACRSSLFACVEDWEAHCRRIADICQDANPRFRQPWEAHTLHLIQTRDT